MGGAASRSNVMRNYIGTTEQYGRASGRPAGSTGLNMVDPSFSGSAGGVQDVEQNSPEGGGGQMSAGWVAPAIDAFANVNTLSPSILSGMRSMFTQDQLKNEAMRAEAMKSLGGSYVWDDFKKQFVPSSGGATSGGMQYGAGNTGLNFGYGG